MRTKWDAMSDRGEMSWLYKARKGRYRHLTAVRCIKPRRGKYRPRSS